VRSPTAEQLQTLLNQIKKCVMKALTRHGALIEEEGMSCLAEIETGAALVGPFAIGGLYLPGCAWSSGRIENIDIENHSHTNDTTAAANPGHKAVN
jgi:hypothetical protein